MNYLVIGLGVIVLLFLLAIAGRRAAGLIDKSTRRCSACGCTDRSPCVNLLTGERCVWIDGYAGNLCSECARTMRPFQTGGPEPPAGRAA